ncbi:MAG: ATP-binding protein [Vicinamibacterales bacterium]
MPFRTKIFLTALASAAIAAIVATALVSWSVRRGLEERIARELAAEARMAAELLSHRSAATEPELDAEADDLGRILGARVTFIAGDGRVVGDSELTLDQIRTVENHGTRPEVIDARAHGFGTSRRHSATLGTDMMYVALPVTNPGMPTLSIVRLALPLTGVDRQLAAVRRLGVVGFGAGLVAALALAWLSSTIVTRRVRDIADVAARYAKGDVSRRANDGGGDEIAAVARVLDDSVHQLSDRIAELAADRARMEAILSGMIEGVLVVDEHERVQLANEAARRLLEINQNPAGRHYLEMVRDPAVKQQIAAALAGKAPASAELHGRRHDVTLIARTASVDAPAGRGAVVVLHDITDLRRADQMRRDFVANVSHELRTPLTAIRGYLEALTDATAEESKRFLEILTRQTQRMERLIRDLLRLARLDARQETLERGACSVEGLFNHIETDLATLLAARRHTMERRIAPDADTVYGDSGKLQDALRNLVENAINYSPDGTVVTLASERRNGLICVRVLDQGPGIPPADLSRVFERFYRVDKSRTREARDPGGTGLGLSIVRHLVELHGGRVTAENRPERGAVFTIELPAE